VRFLIHAAILSMLFLSPAQAKDKGREMIADEKGVASFYGWRHHGRRMANGRRFNALGAAAGRRTLPLGCRVRLTNLANGRSTDVTVEDRGPYVGGRIMDLSLGAARRLGMTKVGIAMVLIRPVFGEPLETKAASQPSPRAPKVEPAKAPLGVEGL
jgi:rare lipoprotein A (peptidoglycan hydrolase)